MYVCLEKSRNDGQVTLFEKCETQRREIFSATQIENVLPTWS